LPSEGPGHGREVVRVDLEGREAHRLEAPVAEVLPEKGQGSDVVARGEDVGLPVLVEVPGVKAIRVEAAGDSVPLVLPAVPAPEVDADLVLDVGSAGDAVGRRDDVELAVPVGVDEGDRLRREV